MITRFDFGRDRRGTKYIVPLPISQIQTPRIVVFEYLISNFGRDCDFLTLPQCAPLRAVSIYVWRDHFIILSNDSK